MYFHLLAFVNTISFETGVSYQENELGWNHRINLRKAFGGWGRGEEFAVSIKTYQGSKSTITLINVILILQKELNQSRKLEDISWTVIRRTYLEAYHPITNDPI